MSEDQALAEGRGLLAQLTSLTVNGSLRWERQARSAHRYARWNNSLLILGPTSPIDDDTVPRYLFITPFSSPTGTEITSDDTDLRVSLLALVYAVEAATSDQKPKDPFALSEQALPGSE
jgi:hypothetical protein